GAPNCTRHGGKCLLSERKPRGAWNLSRGFRMNGGEIYLMRHWQFPILWVYLCHPSRRGYGLSGYARGLFDTVSIRLYCRFSRNPDFPASDLVGALVRGLGAFQCFL